MELTKKQLREQREFQTAFKDPKHARAMWSKNVADRYCKPAFKPVLLEDKDGNLLPQSQIEFAVWDQLNNEIEAQGLSRLPTEGEMMEGCQAYYSRHNAASYVARRDSMGAKPIDETKQQHVVNDPLEGLTDEELIIMQKALELHREKQAQIEGDIADDE